MPSRNKDRLYVSLCARGGKPKMPGLEDTYHWALIIGPKKENKNSKGKRFHAKESLVKPDDATEAKSVWVFDEREIGMEPTGSQLARILVAKIEDRDKLESILRGVPLHPETQGWNCVAWVREALELAADGGVLGTSMVAWDTVRDSSMKYVADKRAARRYETDGGFDQSKVATWDLLQGCEVTP